MGSFTVNIPINNEKAMDNFQKVMDNLATDHNKYILIEAERFGISEQTAADIVYLRSRSYWTQIEEDKLIKSGKL